ncbi:MAG: PIG-L family deacetylase [Ilumatobacter sp.]|uniref:PIG-L deacetylase family protein n=1 Tax=Ilumatobacter sp. TaxID=1967498 RepID=UPI0032990D21
MKSSLDRWTDVRESATLVTPNVGRYLVVAPHPDDEVLTVGGLLARLVRAGSDVEVLAVTDGGNAYPKDYEHDALARVRRAEQTDALGRLGIRPDRVTWLGIRDGSVADHEIELSERISCESDPGTTIVAPWVHDVHPDHEAVGRAAARAARLVGCSLWSSLFWAWHHAEPRDLGGVDLVRVGVDGRSRHAKQAALACHASQLEPPVGAPILDDWTLEPSQWDSEYFIVNRPEVPGR